MARTLAHEAAVQIAQHKGAMHLSSELVNAVFLDNLKQTLLRVPGGGAGGGAASWEIIPGRVAVSLGQTSIDPNVLTASVIELNPGELAVHIEPGFDITFDVHVPGNPASRYSTITLNVPSLDLPLTGRTSQIHVDVPATLAPAIVVDDAGRNATVAATGISIDDLLRVEGSIAYASAPRLFASALGEFKPVELKSLFPGIDFGGDLTLAIVERGLLVIPEWLSVIGNTGCPQGDATSGSDVFVSGKNRNGNTLDFAIQSGGWPAAAAAHPLHEDGVASLYLPKPILDLKFGKIKPAADYSDSGNGFIGYNIHLETIFRGVGLSVDVPNGALLLKVDFQLLGSLTANVDVPCVGRKDFARCEIQIPDSNGPENGVGSISVRLRLGVDTGGRLLLLAEIDGISLGTAKVDLSFFGNFAGIAGPEGAVAGYILDGIVGRVLANNLPAVLFDMIKSAVNDKFFVLADLKSVIQSFDRKPNKPAFSGDPDSVFIGMKYAG